MRSRLPRAKGPLALSGLAAVAAITVGIGCASILSIPDRSLAPASDAGGEGGAAVPVEWCDQPGNKHDFCDDFDHADAGAEWTTGDTDGAIVGFTSSSDSPPTALDLSTVPEPLGAGTVGGLYMPFSQKFTHVHFAVDVRVVALDLRTEQGVSAELGFLLLEQTGFCIGTVFTPAGIGIIMRSESTDCTSVNDLPADAGSSITDDAGLTTFAIVAPIPSLNEWSHISLDVKRNSDGSGALGFDINFPGRVPPPQIPPGYLTEDPPAIAVATSIVGPSGRAELQFDNVTVDFPTN